MVDRFEIAEHQQGTGSGRSESLPVACPDRFLAVLQHRGFQPTSIVDVGANLGMWTRTALRYFPQAHYTLIEPQAELRHHIEDLVQAGSKITWHTAGAADQSGTLELTVNPRPDSSSFVLSQEQADSLGFARRPVPVVTLNELVASGQLRVPEMVKIDAEGFDLKVFSGASDLYGKTEVFFIEASVCSYGFENTTANVVRAMDEADYRLVDITDLNRSPKHDTLWLCEFVFLHNGSQLFEGVYDYA